MVIVRRPDERNDPRKDQPLVKTLDRLLPLKETLAKQIHNYIVRERKTATTGQKHDFLFVTHKQGPTFGLPISKAGYQKIFSTVIQKFPKLSKLYGHLLRHTWNENFSQYMDNMLDPPTEEKQEKYRAYLMGWKEGSGTAATYNQRFIQQKAHDASLKLQDGLLRLPKVEDTQK